MGQAHSETDSEKVAAIGWACCQEQSWRVWGQRSGGPEQDDAL
jgi:hypothetical protein